MNVRLVVIGDVAILLGFAATGRSAHHEGGAILGTLGVAAPFIAGWFLSAWWQRVYAAVNLRSVLRAVVVTARTWLVGGLIGLAIRSVLEGHLTPPAFVAIALGFNLILLCAWHALTARHRGRQWDTRTFGV